MQRTCIIIVNFNGWQDTIECLDSILTVLDQSNFFVCIVDNSENYISFQKLNAYFLEKIAIDQICRFNTYTEEDFCNDILIESKSISLIKAKNRGFAAANNIVLRNLLLQGYEGYFWLLNNDTVVTKDSLNALINNIEKSRLIGITGSCLLYYAKRTVVQGLGGKYNKLLGTSYHIGEGKEYSLSLSQEQIDYPIGASLLVKSDFVEEVGLMNEIFFLYFEELDWILRGKKLGWSFNVALDSVVYHKEGGSIGSKADKSKSDLADYWALKNRIVFTRIHFSRFIPLIYLGFTVVLFNRLRRFQLVKFQQVLKILFNT